MKISTGRAALLLVGLLVETNRAHADPFHYRNLLIGDRAVGLGGAYVALADDTSALFHNPAGAVYSQQLASATVNALSRTTTRFDGFFPDGGSLGSKSSGLVPSYFGILRHTDIGTLGLSIAVTDFVSERQLDRGKFSITTDRGTTADVEEFLTGDVDYRQYAAGPTYAAKTGGGLSLGMTLYATFRDLREARSIGGNISGQDPQNAALIARTAVQTSYRIEDTQYGLRPILGIAYGDPSCDRFGFGLTVSRDFGLKRDYEYLYRSNASDSRIDSAGQTTPRAVLDVASDSSSSVKQRLPWQVSAGLAFRPADGWWISAQADHYFAVDQRVIVGADGNSPPVTRQFQAVTDFALGVEAPLSDHAALRVAGFTDFANVDVDRAGKFERREEVDLYGFSIGGAYRDRVREYKAGVYVSAGDGRARLGDLDELNFSKRSNVDVEGRRLVVFFGAEL